MNFVQEFEVLSRSSMKMIDPSAYEVDPPETNTPYSATSSSNQFDYLMQDNVDTIASENKASDEASVESSSMRGFMMNGMSSLSLAYPSLNSVMNNTSNSYYTLRRPSRSSSVFNPLSSNPMNNSCGYLMDKNIKFSNEFSNTSIMNKFQFILMAPTSPGVKLNEDTLTYLNQGQNYELKLSRIDIGMPHETSNQEQFAYMTKTSNTVEDIKPVIINLKNDNSDEDNLNQDKTSSGSSGSCEDIIKSAGKLENCELGGFNYMSVVRLCFWDRKLQEMEQDEIKEWEKEYQNMKMLEIDNNSSYGTVEIRLSEMYTNAAEVIWNGRTGASVFFRCNCTSTAFAPHKHGGEKGIHMRLQIDTYEVNPDSYSKLDKLHSNSALNRSETINNFANNPPSILSPPNSSSGKLIKEDLENNVGADFYSSQATSGRRRSARLNSSTNGRCCSTPSASTPSTLDWCDYWRHLCSSYSRIQLFRLKGAQRKLKTDRSKVERLCPPDLRKRYQPSSKITLLYNCPFDPLYSLLPFVRYDFNIGNQNSHQSNTLMAPAANNQSLSHYSVSNESESGTTTSGVSSANTSSYQMTFESSSMYQTGYQQQSSELTDQNNSDSVAPISSYQYQSESNSSSNKKNNGCESIMPNSSQNVGNTSAVQTVNEVQQHSRYPATFCIDTNLSTYSVPVSSNLNSQIPLQQQQQSQLIGLTNVTKMCATTNIMSLENAYNSQENSTNTTNNILYGSENRLKRNSSNISHLCNAQNNSYTYPYNNRNKFQKLNSSTPASVSSVTGSLVYSTNGISSSLQSASSPQLYTSQFMSPSSNSSSTSTSNSSSPGSPISPHLNQAMPRGDHGGTLSTSNLNQCTVQSTLNDHSSNISINCYNNVAASIANNGVLSAQQQSTIFNSINQHYVNTSLPYDCSNKYLQDWLAYNRFTHLTPLFNNYASNDLLRLSKEDMINLCGGPDGIRCYNMAHNIQIKPKLTIFVTFQTQSYYSAIFLTDWKSRFLVDKIYALYAAYVNSLGKSEEEDKESETKNKGNDNLERGQMANVCKNNNNSDSEYHSAIYSRLISCKNSSWELFLKIKGILVKTTDEVLNNLQDQSRFLIEFDWSTGTDGLLNENINENESNVNQTESHNDSNTSANKQKPDSWPTQNSNFLKKTQLINNVAKSYGNNGSNLKIIMIPVDK